MFYLKLDTWTHFFRSSWCSVRVGKALVIAAREVLGRNCPEGEVAEEGIEPMPAASSLLVINITLLEYMLIHFDY